MFLPMQSFLNIACDNCCMYHYKAGTLKYKRILFLELTVHACLCLSQRDKISRFIYLHQVSYINVKINMHMSATRFKNTYQDLHASTSSLINIHQVLSIIL